MKQKKAKGILWRSALTLNCTAPSFTPFYTIVLFHHKIPPFELLLVKSERFHSFCRGAHFYRAPTPRTSLGIRGNFAAHHVSALGKAFFQRLRGNFPSQIADVEMAFRVVDRNFLWLFSLRAWATFLRLFGAAFSIFRGSAGTAARRTTTFCALLWRRCILFVSLAILSRPTGASPSWFGVFSLCVLLSLGLSFVFLSIQGAASSRASVTL